MSFIIESCCNLRSTILQNRSLTILCFIMFKLKQTKPKSGDNFEKYGFKRDLEMRNSTQNPIKKTSTWEGYKGQYRLRLLGKTVQCALRGLTATRARDKSLQYKQGIRTIKKVRKIATQMIRFFLLFFYKFLIAQKQFTISYCKQSVVFLFTLFFSLIHNTFPIQTYIYF